MPKSSTTSVNIISLVVLVHNPGVNTNDLYLYGPRCLTSCLYANFPDCRRLYMLLCISIYTYYSTINRSKLYSTMNYYGITSTGNLMYI